MSKKEAEINVNEATNKELTEMYTNTKKFIEFLDKAEQNVEEE